MQTLSLMCDATELLAALDLLEAHLDLARESGQSPLDLSDIAAELARVETDASATAATGELVVRLQPGDGLRRYMAAVAGDPHLAFENHGTPPLSG